MRATFTAVLLCAASAAAASDDGVRVVVHTCPGRGYLPYAYPAFGGCPCGEDGCFPSGRYYACDDGYEKSFWRRWRRAHFGGGSMLDGIPCRCITPPGRAVSVPLAAAKPEPVAPSGAGGIESGLPVPETAGGQARSETEATPHGTRDPA
jgi:hypothetical protein